jgi:gamma-glutamylcyclotransferase (GGCT)/AIG2-like uncharacterized protein YtfP
MLCETAAYLGAGRLAGELYGLGSYPGAVVGGPEGGWITGDVFELREPAKLLAVLDEYEDFRPAAPERGEFRRVQSAVELGAGESLLCWVYVYNRPTLNLSRIPSGDYFRGIHIRGHVTCRTDARGAERV